MFIKIGSLRIKLSSIGEYKPSITPSNNQLWYIEIKVSGKNRIIYFSNKTDLDNIVIYIDKALKVLDI